MNAIHALFYQAPPMRKRDVESSGKERTGSARARIGVFRDAAFSFYYPDNLDALKNNGAELVFINSFEESSLPGIDALYLGGGFPELFFDVLSANKGLLRDVRERVEAGMPLYAECGGLIYLCRSASYGGKNYSLAGILPIDIGFEHHPAGHGYLDLKSRTDTPWFRKGIRVRAHEFHYSSPAMPPAGCSYQFDVIRGNGITGQLDGVVYRNLFASFAHLHVVGNPGWAETFLSLASEFKAARH
jgi:cobyrinic acid a,c-diamide synthase